MLLSAAPSRESLTSDDDLKLKYLDKSFDVTRR